jgi:UDP-glucose 4-epimerase
VNERPISWVIGAGGLLGSNVERALARRSSIWRPEGPIPWATSAAHRRLEAAVSQFAAVVGERPWLVAWCAGTGVIAATPDALLEEEAALDVVLEALSRRLPRGSDGRAFVASSAGGIYAGSMDPPFTEETPIRPISPYGEMKVRLEKTIAEWASAHGWSAVIGRISNLYGPGQNLAKPQGLISHLCRAHLLRQPISIYVPLDTVRDYLYAQDCGELVADLLATVRLGSAVEDGCVRVKILASQRGVTIGAILGEFRRVFKHSIKVVHGASTATRFQARDLRFRSVAWSELDRRTFTPLPAGIRTTVNHLTRQLQAGSLHA